MTTSNRTKDMVGKTYGHWTITAVGTGKQKLVGRCVCGTVRETLYAPNLKTGKSQSCGCVSRAAAAKRNTTHGRTGTREYWVWKGMISRCDSPSNKSYPRYGGRGITVCPEWYDIDRFLRDMGPKPSPSHSLERVDNDMGYSAENCVWATQAEQVRNTRRTKKVVVAGETICAKDACADFGIAYTTFLSRCVDAGLTHQEGVDAGLLSPDDMRFKQAGASVRIPEVCE